MKVPLPFLVGFVISGGLVLALTGSLLPSIAVLLGPLAGAAVRNWQRCCTENSLTLAPFAVALLAVGCLTRRFFHPQTRGGRVLRGTLWWLGALGWFFSALLSYGHALS